MENVPQKSWKIMENTPRKVLENHGKHTTKGPGKSWKTHHERSYSSILVLIRITIRIQEFFIRIQEFLTLQDMAIFTKKNCRISCLVEFCFHRPIGFNMSPPLIGGGIKRCFCLMSDVSLTSDICLSRTSGLSREQRGLGRLKLAQR